MMRFTCPACKAVVEAPEHFADRNLPCGRCGRLLRIPALPLAKTVLGVPMSAHPPSGPPASPPTTIPRQDMPAKRPNDKGVCPACGYKFRVIGGLAGKNITCSRCGVSLSFDADGAPSVVSAGPKVPTPAPPIKPAAESPDWLSDLAPQDRPQPPLDPTPSSSDSFDLDDPEVTFKNEKRPGMWKPYFLGIAAFLLGVAALPSAIALASNWLGVLLAGFGVILALCAVISSLTKRAAGLGLAAMSLLVCGASLFGAVELSGGVTGLLNMQAHPRAKAGDTEQDPGAPADAPGNDSSHADSPKPDDQPNPDEKPKSEDQPKPGSLAAMIRDLNKGESAARIRAAEQLGKMGEAAKPAARALCSAATDDSKEIRGAAIEALEKVEPSLAEPVTTLLVDGQNSYAAAQQIGRMGEKASPAIHVLIWNARHLTGPASIDIEALAKVGPTDPEAVRAIIDFALSQIDLRGRKGTTEKETALSVLGQLGQNQGSLRQEIVACLVKALTACEAGLDGQQRYYHQTSALAAIGSLAEYGPDAKEAIPALRRLKLNSDIQIRQATAAALEKIDK